jgi:signal transduction histidine kinase
VIQLHPDLQRVVVVTGASAYDHSYEEPARAQFRAFEDRLQFTYLTGLPMPELLLQVSALPPDTVIYHLHVSEDGDGARFQPYDVLDQLAARANRPIYHFSALGLGRGIVGGRMLDLEAVWKATADLALRLLKGESPDSIPVREIDGTTLSYDWRELRRWGISEARLPAGSIVRFRSPSFWELYRGRIIITISVIASQTTLIIALLVQRRRKRQAEMQAQRDRLELAHASRLTTAGELTASIAHELNQPLGAILRNAEAAEMMLQTNSPDLEELRAIVSDIRADDQRAGQVIDRLRGLLKRHRVESQPLGIHSFVEEVTALVRADAASRRVQLETEAPAGLPLVNGDRVHLQQVLLNLILNGMDALSGVTAHQRCVKVRAKVDGERMMELSVSDNGHGILEVIRRVVANSGTKP